MARTKYNVNKDPGERTYDGIEFDSKMEMEYYRDIVLPGVNSGDITHYELQKKFVLQDGFKRNGKTVLPIIYVTDFYIEHADGRCEVVDIKGFADSVALLKRKMFWCRYPQADYRWMTYVKKYGGWVEYEELKKLRAKSARNKNTQE